MDRNDDLVTVATAPGRGRSPFVMRTVAALFLAVALAACGSGEGADTADTAEDTDTATTAPASPAQPSESDGSETAATGDIPPYAQNIQDLKSQTVDTAPYEKEGPYTIAVLTQGPFNGWGKSLEVTAQWAASNHEEVDDAVLLSAEGDVDKQVSQLENALQQQPDAIVMQPVGDALVGGARQATEAGIPVVLCGNGLPDPSVYATVVTVDYWTTGVEIAEGLAEDIGGEGNVVIMGGNPAYEHTQIYEQAAKETLAKYPDIDIVATTYSEYSVAKGKTDMEAVLTSNPQIDGIYAAGSEAAIGAIQALQERNIDVPPMAVSNDINGFVRLADEIGFKYTAAPAPAPMSAACVDTAVAILKGEQGIPRFQAASEVVPGTETYDESQLADHYWEEFNDDFVGPPVAPEQVYLDAGFGR